MEAAPRTPDPLTLGAFALATTLGGLNFIAVRYSNRELPPFWGAGLRFAAAALLFVGIVALLRLPWPRGRRLVDTALYGVLGFAVFFALMYWALVRVTAGAATVVLAIVPLMTLLLAAVQGLERLRARNLIGALLAVAGIGWMTFGPREVSVPPSAAVAMLLGAAAVAQSLIVGKRLSDTHPAVTNAVGMSAAVPLLLGVSLVVGESWHLPREAPTVAAVAYLSTLGSVGLFVLVLLVVRRWTPSATSYAFVLFPIITMALEALISGERVTLEGVAGALLVMAGVWFGALAPGAKTPPSALPTHGLPDAAANT
ncbi:MAG TPA: EamA family transporter [Actinomycetota bacterium]|nr:EamA family transporter [Actinomycetota bacterium]